MLVKLAERGVLPDGLIRFGIRRLLAERLKNEATAHHHGQPNGQSQRERFLEYLRESSIAIETDAANEQHYEVSSEFFERVLGPRMKYSCCLFDGPDTRLEEAERAMLAVTCRRAELQDGMSILDLGCGWGSLSLWIAEHFPNCRITALSNSAGQREFIESRCRSLGLRNVRVVTANVDEFDTEEQFDRICSIEMFEHVRNYEQLMTNIARWLSPCGKLFVHIFCHQEFAYPFTTDRKNDWMGRHFFTGGVMPSEDLLLEFQQELEIEQQWKVSGMHYARTLEGWLTNLDRNRLLARQSLHALNGSANLAIQRWRMFFMACAELFAYRGGDEWYVAHYRFGRREI